ncbi:MAG: hypothetical protein ACK4QW_13860 [Alphaproteobacteria bacterium]
MSFGKTGLVSFGKTCSPTVCHEGRLPRQVRFAKTRMHPDASLTRHVADVLVSAAIAVAEADWQTLYVDNHINR